MSALTSRECQSIAGIGLLFALRMLGMFMVVPVLAIYGARLQGATPLLIGMAIGIYGLAQALFQIPFGLWSDRVGRRPLILLGLFLMLIGSLLPACSDHIAWLILGRFLQGAGAISAVLMALLSDLTSERYRSLGMAVIGMSFGGTFALATCIGPWLASHAGISAVFWLVAGLAATAIACLLWFIPKESATLRNREAELIPAALGSIWQDKRLMQLNLGIFMLHLLLMLSFQALPSVLSAVGYLADQQWSPMLGAMVIAMVLVIPCVVVAERYQRVRYLYLVAIGLLLFAEGLWWGGYGDNQGQITVLLALGLFFLGFNLLEALLPTLVSKLAPAGLKGTAMGVYSTAQFFGIACGGGLGGLLAQQYGASGLLTAATVIALLWWGLSWQIQEPGNVRGVRLELEADDLLNVAQLQSGLQALPGVLEVMVVPEEASAYLKIDKQLTAREPLMRWISSQRGI